MAREGIPRRLRRLFRLPWVSAATIARDVDDELHFHIEMRAAELMASGLDAESATAEAWRSFGHPSAVRDHAIAVNARVVRRAHVREWLVGAAHDARFALRQTRRTPLLTISAVATLALSIGASTAIFSVVHRLLIAPFPFDDSDRMVWISMKNVRENAISLIDANVFDAWRTRAYTLEAIGATRAREVELRDGTRIETISAGAMSAGFLQFVGAHPALGRGFEPSDERSGAAPVAMLGYEEWESKFGGRSEVIGHSITIDSAPHVIVGVAPAGFVAPFDNGPPKRVWLLVTQSSRALSVIGKLRRGVAIDAVNRELTAVAGQVPGERLDSSESAQAQREQDIYQSLRRGILLLFASVGVVLLIGCANVANLLLVRAWSRKRELAIRTALGAGRARLTRQLIVESLTIATAGGVGGVAFASAAISVVIKLRPRGLEVLDHVYIEPVALAWTTIIALSTGLVFGLVPALFATPRAMAESLKAGQRETSGRRGARVFRSSIVVFEIALSVMLLVGAGLLVRSFHSLSTVELGFASHGFNSVTVRAGRAVAPPLRRAMIAAFLQRLRQTPGIQGAALATSLPPHIGAGGLSIQREDRAVSESAQYELAGSIEVQPSFFNVAGIKVRGRTFNADSTGMDSLPAAEVVINERLAQRLWPGGDAIGQRVRIGKTVNNVVGVANNITIPGESGEQSELQWYRPWFRLNDDDATVVFRSEMSEVALDSAVHRAMRGASVHLTVARKASSDEELRVMLAPMKFATALVSGFAIIALCLSVVGLYGVVAFTVSQRTREIGVRIALGAQSRDIARAVAVDGGALVAIGLLVGLALSTASSPLLKAYLYSVGERDPFTYAAIVVILGAAALLAGYLPARRAMHVDPVVALSAD